eukprot:TRINITY_DN34198_c0_g1_i1.p1 TRINITY_DN34198_c0_g1~~TRINITY_DN34198_c0_g1_i1.p1  ORF type:complete len:575 (+),score=102.09 TRINITY_DN34198_c0_g1_i1:52-1725(+)
MSWLDMVRFDMGVAQPGYVRCRVPSEKILPVPSGWDLQTVVEQLQHLEVELEAYKEADLDFVGQKIVDRHFESHPPKPDVQAPILQAWIGCIDVSGLTLQEVLLSSGLSSCMGDLLGNYWAARLRMRDMNQLRLGTAMKDAMAMYREIIRNVAIVLSDSAAKLALSRGRARQLPCESKAAFTQDETEANQRMLTETNQLAMEVTRLTERCEQQADAIGRAKILERQIQEMRGELQGLHIEIAVLKERCGQRDKLEAENTRLRGEVSDLSRVLLDCFNSFCTARPEATNDRRGDAAQYAAAPAQVAGGTSSGSESGSESFIKVQSVCASSENSAMSGSLESSFSCISIATSGPHCFLEDTVFTTAVAQDLTDTHLLRASDLVKGSRVLASDGSVLEVVHNPVPEQATELVELQTAGAMLKVTPSHRVTVAKASAEEHELEDVRAGDLQKGDRVIESGQLSALTSISQISLATPATVLKISFKPDKPVEAFMLPESTIASKGYPKKEVRRGGMNKRGQPGNGANDAASVPDTAVSADDLPAVCMAYHAPPVSASAAASK